MIMIVCSVDNPNYSSVAWLMSAFDLFSVVVLTVSSLFCLVTANIMLHSYYYNVFVFSY